MSAPGPDPEGPGASAGRGAADDEAVVRLERWKGPWPDADPDANFKADVALYASLDPMATIRDLSRSLDVPEGAIVHYVLAKYCTGGSGGLLEIGPSMVHRLCEPIDRAERAGDDAARLDAYRQLRDMIRWLRLPLVDDAIYRAPRGGGVEDSGPVAGA